MKNLCLVAVQFTLFTCCLPASADIIEFRLTGNAGDGLLGGNVNPVTPTNPGSGAIGPTGIFLDTDSNTLFIDIVWGSANGFDDLTGQVTMLHLHGMTADPAPASFSQTSSNVLVNLGNSSNFDDSASSGGLVNNVFIGNPDIQGLLEGRTYINVHTDLNPSGELRGYLVVVPEPHAASLLPWLIVFAINICCARRYRSANPGSPRAGSRNSRIIATHGSLRRPYSGSNRVLS